jgi:guanylate kinase
VFSVSATTRPQRAGEVEGGDYHFVDQRTFQEMRDRDEFLECAEVFGRDWYGTPRRPVMEQLEEGRLVILDIDVQGALQVKDSMPQAYMIFIRPPSEAELLGRLRGRAREDEATIQRRFEKAKWEIEKAETSGKYDGFIVNDNLEEAVEQLCALIRAKAPRLRTACG